MWKIKIMFLSCDLEVLNGTNFWHLLPNKLAHFLLCLTKDVAYFYCLPLCSHFIGSSNCLIPNIARLVQCQYFSNSLKTLQINFVLLCNHCVLSKFLTCTHTHTRTLLFLFFFATSFCNEVDWCPNNLSGSMSTFL